MQWKIFALIGSFMLVIMLMSEVRKPETWRWLWGLRNDAPRPAEQDVDTRLRMPEPSGMGPVASDPLILPSDEPEQAIVVPSAPSAEQPHPQLDQAAALAEARRDAWSRLLKSLSLDERTRFLAGLKGVRDRSPRPPEEQAVWPELLAKLDAGWEDYLAKATQAMSADDTHLTDAEKDLWRQVITTLKSDWQDGLRPTLQAIGRPAAPTAELQAAVGTLQATLDAVFLGEVRDNTVFRAVETDAWFRFFEELRCQDAATLRRSSLGHVGFLQLYKQPADYRGKLVTVRGTIHLGSYSTSHKNLYGIDGYYIFWLRPTGAKSPIVVYSLEIPPGFPDVKNRSDQPKTPLLEDEVEFTGYFFKRWPYRAQDGTRLAPLVLAKTPDWKPSARAADLRPDTPSLTFLVLLFGGTGLFGLGAALLVYWLTRRPTAQQAALSRLEAYHEEQLDR